MDNTDLANAHMSFALSNDIYLIAIVILYYIEIGHAESLLRWCCISVSYYNSISMNALYHRNEKEQLEIY